MQSVHWEEEKKNMGKRLPKAIRIGNLTDKTVFLKSRGNGTLPWINETKGALTTSFIRNYKRNHSTWNVRLLTATQQDTKV